MSGLTLRPNAALGSIDPRRGKSGQTGGYDVLLNGVQIGTVERVYSTWQRKPKGSRIVTARGTCKNPEWHAFTMKREMIGWKFYDRATAIDRLVQAYQAREYDAERFNEHRAALGDPGNQALADALRLVKRDGRNTVRRYGDGGNKRGIPGPVQVAMEAFVAGFRPVGVRFPCDEETKSQ